MDLGSRPPYRLVNESWGSGPGKLHEVPQELLDHCWDGQQQGLWAHLILRKWSCVATTLRREHERAGLGREVASLKGEVDSDAFCVCGSVNVLY